MANCETHNLPVLELESHQIREALRCVLHTIIFNRALGYVIPKDVDSELFDITYVQCGDPGVEAKVESRISDFCTQVEKKPAELHQLQLSFYETRRKQAWFGTQDERLYWETWVISVLVLQPDIGLQQQGPQAGAPTSAGAAAAPGQQTQTQQQQAQAQAASQVRAARQARLQSALEEQLGIVVRRVNDRRDHIPPVLSASAVTFPFDISISGSSTRGSLQGGLQAVGKMLMKATPPPVLG
ncbi:hypothetical protein PLESTB_001417200 [Pleodorina starrii]|uniref:Autophagy-related protein 101 n=1 Tax=Pleodorina starrii TaxID=330485 RepID=A0A9W6F740_9CHLO|nr:hypothetical protein PLESTM_001378900 [Pleodorina starrii]GLC58917.1 hypothetical protein PLESTB_001417200 [Pleodorina starrii]GLC65078.1 hypothetical protein PLESTF_000244300 [Pleodorina starrii]